MNIRNTVVYALALVSLIDDFGASSGFASAVRRVSAYTNVEPNNFTVISAIIILPIVQNSTLTFIYHGRTSNPKKERARRERKVQAGSLPIQFSTRRIPTVQD